MEHIPELILKTYGIVGLIILSPFVAMTFLWRSLHSLQKAYNKLQDERVADAKSISEKLITMVGEQSALNKETNLALDRVGDMLTIVSNSPYLKR